MLAAVDVVAQVDLGNLAPAHLGGVQVWREELSASVLPVSFGAMHHTIRADASMASMMTSRRPSREKEMRGEGKGEGARRR